MEVYKDVDIDASTTIWETSGPNTALEPLLTCIRAPRLSGPSLILTLVFTEDGVHPLPTSSNDWANDQTSEWSTNDACQTVNERGTGENNDATAWGVGGGH